MIEGFRFLPEYFSTAAQKALLAEVLHLLDECPLYRGIMEQTHRHM